MYLGIEDVRLPDLIPFDVAMDSGEFSTLPYLDINNDVEKCKLFPVFIEQDVKVLSIVLVANLDGRNTPQAVLHQSTGAGSSDLRIDVDVLEQHESVAPIQNYEHHDPLRGDTSDPQLIENIAEFFLLM